MKFKDSAGTEYEFRATAGNIIRAEKRCGERLLANLLKAVSATDEAEQAEALFGSTDRFCAVLYECSVDKAAQADLSFEQFCDLLEYSALFEIMPVMIEALFASFAMPGGSQLPPDDDEGGTDEKKGRGT